MYTFRRLPRNASTSISSISDFKVLDSDTLLSNDMDLDKTFSVIRNPYDRAVSMYHWFRKEQTFSEFVQSLIHRDNFNVQQLWHTNEQFKYVSVNDKIAITLFRFEILSEDFDLFGYKLPHLNKSKRKGYKNYYTCKTREIVEHVYRNDFKHFNYRWE